jgi:hypothetical protein
MIATREFTDITDAEKATAIIGTERMAEECPDITEIPETKIRGEYCGIRRIRARNSDARGACPIRGAGICKTQGWGAKPA